MLFPLYWVIVTSIKPSSDYLATPPVWFPAEPTIVHYVAALFAYRGLEGLVNSLIVASATTVASVALGTCMGYSMVRFHTGGRDLAFWVLSQRFLPPVAVVLPLFLLYRNYGLYDTRLGLVLIYTVMTLPLSVWMMYAYFRQVPRALEEAALVDGCGWWQAFWRIAVPLAIPGIIAAAAFAFIAVWTEFFFALNLTSRYAFTLPTVFRSFLGFEGAQYGEFECARGDVPASLGRARYARAAALGAWSDARSGPRMTPGEKIPPELAICLFGEPRGPSAGQRISAGPISCSFEGMALRWVEWEGIEILRAIAFVVRDRNWGPYQPEVRVEAFTAQPDAVLLRLAARIAEATAALECRVEIELTAGGLSISARATSRGIFHTNRTGLVVLHPAACAGATIRVEHAAGGTTAGQFPLLVSPHQPFRDIGAIEHEPVPGLVARIGFSGEVFEMEDQRNWTDASFKTYSRPLALPYPYALADGETAAQTVSVSVIGRPRARRGSHRDIPRIELAADAAGRLPRLGIGGRARDYVGTRDQLGRLTELEPALLLLEAEAENPTGPAGSLEGFRAAVEATGARAAVMLRPEREGLAVWRDRLARAGVQPDELALVTANRAVVEEARHAFPGARIGAGTDAFFAECNRIPPPTADFLFWTVNPTVHATDDDSVMETLSVLADQAATARARHPDAALWCGPVTLRMRFNPNATGPAVADPPELPPADVDARQRGLFTAAFTLGQIAGWSAAGVETLVLYAPFGPRGVIHRQAAFPQPWYDEIGESVVYPVYHVLAGLAGQSGCALSGVCNGAAHHVVALATPGELWLANRRAQDIEIQVPGTRVRTLDSTSYAEATSRPEEFWTRDPTPLSRGLLRLGAYAVARVSLR